MAVLFILQVIVNSNGNNTGSGYSGQRYSGNGSNRGNSGAMRSYRGDERW